MPNEPGAPWPEQGQAREGRGISASMMQSIINALARRIVGGKGINVKAFPGGQIIVEAKAGPAAGGGGVIIFQEISAFPDPVPDKPQLYRYVPDGGFWINKEDQTGYTRIDDFTTNPGTPGT